MSEEAIKIEGVIIYQIPPHLATNPEALEQMGKPIPGGWYFAPETNWDYSKSPFSKAYESEKLVAVDAKEWTDRVK